MIIPPPDFINVFPTGVDPYIPRQNWVDDVFADDVNAMQRSIVAIETYLIPPSGVGNTFVLRSGDSMYGDLFMSGSTTILTQFLSENTLGSGINTEGNIIPTQSGTYDLGSPNMPFRTLYADDMIDTSGSSTFVKRAGDNMFGSLIMTSSDIILSGNSNITGISSFKIIDASGDYVQLLNGISIVNNVNNNSIVLNQTGINTKGHIIPTQSGTDDLGSPSRPFRVVYADDLIDTSGASTFVKRAGDDMFGNLLMSGSSVVNFGDTGNILDNGGGDFLIQATGSGAYLDLYSTSSILIDSSSGITTIGSIVPNSSGVDNLGDASLPFAKVYAGTGNFHAISGLSPIDILSDLNFIGTNIAATNSGTQSIGSPSVPFGTIYVDNIVSTGSTGEFVNVMGDSMTGNLIMSGASVLAYSGDTSDLGSLIAPFAQIYAGTGNFHAISGLSPIEVLSNLNFIDADIDHTSVNVFNITNNASPLGISLFSQGAEVLVGNGSASGGGPKVKIEGAGSKLELGNFTGTSYALLQGPAPSTRIDIYHTIPNGMYLISDGGGTQIESLGDITLNTIGKINTSGSIISVKSGIDNLGSSAFPFGTIYVDNIVSTGSTGEFVNVTGDTMTGDLIMSGASVLAYSSNTTNLGSLVSPFAKVYAGTGNFHAISGLSPIDILSDLNFIGTNIVATNSGTQSIGSPSAPFGTIYVDNIVSTGSTGEFVNVSGDTMTGNLSFSGAHKISGNNTLTLEGTTVNVKANAGISGYVNILGPSSFGTVNIGIDGLPAVISLNSNSSNTQLSASTITLGQLDSNATMTPDTSGTVNIGTAALPFSGVYAKTGYFTNISGMSPINVLSDLQFTTGTNIYTNMVSGNYQDLFGYSHLYIKADEVEIYGSGSNYIDLYNSNMYLKGDLIELAGQGNLSIITITPTGSINTKGNIVPELASIDNLGSLQKPFSTIYVDNIVSSGGAGEYVNVTGDTMTGDLIMSGASVLAYSSNTTNLGSLVSPFAKVYAGTGNFHAISGLSPIDVQSDLIGTQTNWNIKAKNDTGSLLLSANDTGGSSYAELDLHPNGSIDFNGGAMGNTRITISSGNSMEILTDTGGYLNVIADTTMLLQGTTSVTIGNGLNLLVANSTAITTYKNIAPSASGTLTIGSDALPFSSVYAKTGYFTNISGMSPINVLSDLNFIGTNIVATNSGTQNIGSPSIPFGAIYANNFIDTSGNSVGDVVGPISATPNAIAIFSGNTGKLIKNSTITYDVTGIVATLSSSESEFNINPAPSGNIYVFSEDIGNNTFSSMTLQSDGYVNIQGGSNGNTSLIIDQSDHVSITTPSGSINISGSTAILSGINILPYTGNSQKIGEYLPFSSIDLPFAQMAATEIDASTIYGMYELLVGAHPVMGPGVATSAYSSSGSIYNYVSNAGPSIVESKLDSLGGFWNTSMSLGGGSTYISGNNSSIKLLMTNPGGSSSITLASNLITVQTAGGGTGAIVPSTSGTMNIGSPSNTFGTIYVENVVSTGISAGSFVHTTGDSMTGNLTMSGSSILAFSTGTSSIGSSGTPFSGAFFTNATIQNLYGFSPINIGSDLIPTTSGTISLGTLSLPYSGTFTKFINTKVVTAGQYNEVPTGANDGINAVYTLFTAPYSTSLQLWKNGLYMAASGIGAATIDFALSGSTITFVTPPASGSTLICNYNYVV